MREKWGGEGEGEREKRRGKRRKQGGERERERERGREKDSILASGPRNRDNGALARAPISIRAESVFPNFIKEVR